MDSRKNDPREIKTKVDSYYKKKSYSYLLKLLTIFILSITQLSCSPVKKQNRIIIASAGKIDSLDPAQASTLRALQLISALGDPLYRIDYEGNLIPKLAKEKPKVFNNGLTIDIPLREGVLFHDGTIFNAKAMEFSLKRFMKIGTQSYVISDRIKDIETPSSYLLRIHLTKPSSSINGLLTSINLTPISPTAYANHKDVFLNKKFIGTGPYKLISFQPEKQRIEPFDSYWEKSPQNEGIDYINFINSSSLFGAIKSGEVDLLLSNSVEDGHRLALNRMSQQGKLLEGEGPAMEIGYITFKTNSEPLNNKLIRQALSYSLNRKLITKKVSFGLREPLRSIVPPILNKDNKNLWPEYNPQIARELLQSSGYCSKKKLEIPLTFRSNVPADKLLALIWQEQIKRDLSDCMILELNGVESTTVYKQLSEGVYSAVILDWTGAYPDAEAYLSPLLSCEEIIKDKCLSGEAVISGSFWGSHEVQQGLNQSEKNQGFNRLQDLKEVEQYALKGAAYLPVWLVKPRAWAQLNISKPEFDGSGLLLLDRIKKQVE